jgi:plasmid stabilization system protein ParE
LSHVLEVEVTPRAAAQIERAAAWWAENRPAAPDAIRVDFEEAVSLLSRQPGVGARSSTTRYADLRRLYLARVRYHIYYRVRSEKVVILAFWHASRGTGPGL